MRRFGPLPSRERSTGHLKHFNSNFDHRAKFHVRAGPLPVAMHSSESEQSSENSGACDDPHQSRAVSNSLLQLQGDYASGLDSVIACTPEKEFDEQDGLSDCSDFHTPARPSKRRRLPSVSPVKRRQVTVYESDFDGVESFILFPCNPQAWFECQCCALCSNLRVW